MTVVVLGGVVPYYSSSLLLQPTAMHDHHRTHALQQQHNTRRLCRAAGGASERGWTDPPDAGTGYAAGYIVVCDAGLRRALVSYLLMVPRGHAQPRTGAVQQHA